MRDHNEHGTQAPNEASRRDLGHEVTALYQDPPFTRLARTHACHAAGEAVVAIALAGSLFFSLDPSAARSRVLLYLILTLAPFALVGPFIGPALDRAPGGRRSMIAATLAIRAALMVLMIFFIDSLWLFPIAFSHLVMGKTYAVAKAATVPATVESEEELVDKNARLAVLSAVAGAVGAAPALLLQRFLGSPVTLGYACLLYVAGIVLATRLPKADVERAGKDDGRSEQVRSAGIQSAAIALSVLRGVVGFMFFMLAFAFRSGTANLDLSGVGKASGYAVKFALGFPLDPTGEPAWKLSMPIAFWGLGILLGNVTAPKIRERVAEERMILGSLIAVAAAGLAAVWAGGINGAVLLALVVGGAPSIAKLAFDSTVQRDAAGANHGAAFGRFETRFQIMWVLGAIIPVLLKLPLRLGFVAVAVASASAAVTYFLRTREEPKQSEPNQTSPKDAPHVAPNPGAQHVGHPQGDGLADL